jgi:hypothetical protein
MPLDRTFRLFLGPRDLGRVLKGSVLAHGAFSLGGTFGGPCLEDHGGPLSTSILAQGTLPVKRIC